IWKVQLLLNTNAAPSGHNWLNALDMAAASWDSRVEGLNIDVAASSAHHPCDGYRKGSPARARVNTVAFSDHVCSAEFGRNTLAATLIIAKEGRIREADIVFNRRYRWDLYSGYRYGRVDFYRVAVHELGHLIGLDHEHKLSAIMAPTISRIDRPTRDDLAGARAIYSGPKQSTLPSIVAKIEQPTTSMSSGVSKLRGWAVAKAGVAKLSLYINQKFIRKIPYGGWRQDIAKIYPDYQNSRRSGFSLAYNWGKLGPGPQEVAVLVEDRQGNKKMVRKQLHVAALRESAPVGLTSRVLGPNLIQVDGVRVASQVYRVLLRWQAKQRRWGMERFERL
ncbi:MAG: matrixin family metalloprotease, partial [Cellvibrionaceae bacterium]|nr:matrixin family metalloprotease [Cellvibrionaceae bacterium]